MLPGRAIMLDTSPTKVPLLLKGAPQWGPAIANVLALQSPSSNWATMLGLKYIAAKTPFFQRFSAAKPHVY